MSRILFHTDLIKMYDETLNGKVLDSSEYRMGFMDWLDAQVLAGIFVYDGECYYEI